MSDICNLEKYQLQIATELEMMITKFVSSSSDSVETSARWHARTNLTPNMYCVDI